MFKNIQASGLRIAFVAGLVAATVFGLAAAGAAGQSGSSGFTSIDVTGAGTKALEGTVAMAIDAAGDVGGIYIDGSGNEHAFVLPAGGTITPFDASGTGGSGAETIPIGFDTAGDLAGIYHDASNHLHGFVRAATTGAITLLDVPGENAGKMEGTFPLGINGAGEIAGTYSTNVTNSSVTNSVTHGFIRSASGTMTTFDAVPLPTTFGSTNPGTFVININASGEVAGFYIDGNGVEHGFLRNASGTVSTFDALGAGTGAEQGTIVTGIDAAGDVIGIYIDTNNAIHGFVRNASTTAITAIDAPGEGTGTYQGTYPDAIDAAGDIFGSFTDTSNTVHGFVLPANGTITTYDAPGASGSDAQLQAAAARLNSKLRQLGRSYGLSLKSRRLSNSPLMKLRSLLARVGAVQTEGSGLLNGNGANPSGTASLGDLILNAANASGEIVGVSTDANYVFHGYLRAANGSITSIDDPIAGTAAKQGTGSLAINASGMIAGTYADSNSVLHGFLFDSTGLAATTTTLTPVPTPNPSVYQEPVTLTASVTSSGGTPANGDTVTFMSGATSLGTGQLTSGTASLTTTDLPVGTDSITAVYGGDSDFAGSTSAAVSQTVGQASSSTTLKSSLNPSTSGQSVTLTANIAGQFSGAATGTVTFSSSGSSLGSASVSNNAATFTTTTLPVGTDAITAVYSGDSNFTGSTSSALSQVVNAATPAATPTFSPVAGTYTSVQTVTISDATSGSTIYYTTNNTTPTTGSTVYTVPIAVSSSETIQAIATASGYSTSAVGSAAYILNLPVFTLFASPSSGVVYNQTVTLTATTSQTVTLGEWWITEDGLNCATNGVVCGGHPNGIGGGFTTVTQPLTAGTHIFYAYYSATAPANNTLPSTGIGQTTLVVGKATPTITWAAPAAITQGTPLSSTQLDATASVAGTFAYTPASGTVLGAGQQTLSVTFTPTDTTDYTTATASVTLTVNPAVPGIMLSTTGLSFSAQNTGSTSTAQTVTLTSSGSGALSITSIAATGDFAETNNCGSSVAAAATCTISVTFTPTAGGTRTGAVNITDNASGSPQSVSLTGIGSTVTEAPSSTSLTISAAGGSATDAIQLSSAGGFSGTVNLSCSVAYTGTGTATDAPTCTLNPTQAQVSSSSGASTTLTVATTAASARLSNPFVPWGGGALAAVLIFIGVPRRRWRGLSLIAILALAIAGMCIGCGGSSGSSNKNPGTTNGNYSVTVTATSGTMTASTSIPLAVQ